MGGVETGERLRAGAKLGFAEFVEGCVEGVVRPVGAGVSELRIDYGPGDRVYLVHRGSKAVVLLCGGDKSTQDRDIEHAQELAKGDGDGT